MIRDFDSAYMDFGAERDYPPAVQDEEPSIDGMQLAAGPSTTMSDAGGAAFGVFPQAGRRRPQNNSGAGDRMLLGTPDAAAGAARGAVTAGLGLGGDIEKLGKFIYRLAADSHGGSFMDRLGRAAGALDERSLLPSSEDLSKNGYTIPGTNITLPPLPQVVPEGASAFGLTPDQRQTAAGFGQTAGELVGDPLVLAKGAKAAGKGAKALVNATKNMPVGLSTEAIGGIEKALTPKGAKLTPDVEVPAAGDVTKPAFKKWFGDSKVTDEKGLPLVVYHGTSRDFQEFSLKFRGENQGNDQFGPGFYSTTSPTGAGGYAVGDGANVMPLYVSIKNPIDLDTAPFTNSVVERLMRASPSFDDALQNFGDVSYEGASKVLRGAVDAYSGYDTALQQLGTLQRDFWPNDPEGFLRAAKEITGHDGVEVDNGGAGKFFVAWTPEQIKSVFNKSTWNPNDPRILHGAGVGGTAAGTATMQDKEQK